MFEMQLLIGGVERAASGGRTFGRLSQVSGAPITYLRRVTIQTAHRHYPI